MKRILPADLFHSRFGRFPVNHTRAGGLFIAHNDIVQDTQLWKKHKLLIDHPDPCPAGSNGRGKMLHLAIYQDFPLVRAVNPGQDIHQGAFPRAVFPYNRMNRSLFYRKVYFVIGDKTAKELRNAP